MTQETQSPPPAAVSRFSAWFEACPHQLAVVALCSILLTLAISFRTDALVPGSLYWDTPADHQKYFYMATHPLGSYHIQPFCWRIAVPTLAGNLPMPTLAAFRLITLLSISAIGTLLFAWLRLLSVPSTHALLGVIMLYSYGSVSKLLIAFNLSPDPASYVCILLALIFIKKRMDWAFALILVVGVCVKETVSLMGPLFYTLRTRKLFDGPLLLRTILVGLPALAMLLTIRVLIPAWNNDPAYVSSLPGLYTEVAYGQAPYDIWDGLKGNFEFYQHMSPINILRLFTFGSLGILLFLPFLDPERNKPLLLRWLPYVGMVGASLLIALNADRRIGSCFPVILLAGLQGLESLSRKLRIPIEWFQIAFLLQFGLLILKRDVIIVPFDLAAAVFLACLVWMYLRRTRMDRQGVSNIGAPPAKKY